MTTVDGQQFSIGDSDDKFCVQSCSKPISYLIALAKFGKEYVHNHVGTEPSGKVFNHKGLKHAPTEDNENRQIPHNPCINSGAIMCTSMLFPDISEREKRLEKVLAYWREL